MQMTTQPESTQSFSTPRLFLRALTLTWRAHPPLATLNTVLLFLSATISPMQVWVSKVTIDRLSALLGPEKATWQTQMSSLPSWQVTLLPLALYLVIWAAGQVARSIEGHVRELLAFQTRAHIQELMYRKASSLDIAFYETPAFYNQLELVSRGSYRVLSLTHWLSNIASQAIALVILLFMLGQINLWFPLILILVSLPYIKTQTHFIRKKADLYMNSVPQQRLMDSLGALMRSSEAVKEIRLFQIQDYLIDRHRRAGEKHYANLANIAIAQEKTTFLLLLLNIAGVVVIWAITGMQALAGAISLGNVAVAFQTIERSRGGFLNLSEIGGFLVENTVYLKALFDFLDLPHDAAEGTLSRSPNAEGVAADLSGPIEFQHVSFCYPGTEKMVLNDISFTIHPGECIALVGENGSGKTTLVKLLTRLYDPVEGVVTIAGRDLHQVDPQAYYQQIGAIFQDFVPYDLTARENIGFGNVAELDNMERIHQAAEKSGAAAVIEGLPQQYDTVLGHYFEDSQNLSGGEWQKIALARAFMRDVPLLILDEPTAALDAFAENAVYQRFADLTRGRTTMFVTHRLSSVQMAEKILVLKQGRLIEVGSHEELMAYDGEYASMFRLQADRYQANKTTDG